MDNNTWSYTDVLFERVLGKSITKGIADTILCSEKLFGYNSEERIGIH